MPLPETRWDQFIRDAPHLSPEWWVLFDAMMQAGEPPPFPFTAPRTRWNAPVTKERVWSPARIEFPRVKALRKATGATAVRKSHPPSEDRRRH